MVKNTKEEKLQTIIETERMLGKIQDVDILLERILSEARAIVRADAGSIYVVQKECLKIRYAQNDTLLKQLKPGEKLPYIFFSMPIDEKSIAGYVAGSGRPVNIADVYDIPADKPFSFNQASDTATGYRTKSIYTIPLKMATGKVLGVMQLINACNEHGDVIAFDEDDELYLDHFAVSATLALEHAYLTSDMVKRMMTMAEFRDPKETYPHVERVSEFSLEIYDRWAFDHAVPEAQKQKFRDNLKIAAKFHDVGKVGISDMILQKTYPRFTYKERSIMQTHTVIGAKLFADSDTELDRMCFDVALHHHEFWADSNSGYPGQINLDTFVPGMPLPSAAPVSGSQIPLAARIVAVADVFDALSHRRSYKDAWSVDDAFAEIQKGSGTHFDPEVVDAFMLVKDRILAILEAYPDTHA